MSLLNSIDRDHVLTAMETWDAAGGANYMLVRGGVSTHVLLHHGREYDVSYSILMNAGAVITSVWGSSLRRCAGAG